MTQITLSIDDTTVLARLAELSGRLSPDGMQAAYSEIGADLALSTKNRFDSSTDPDGNPWPALKTGTVLAALRELSLGQDGWFYKKTNKKHKAGNPTKKGRDWMVDRKPLVDTGSLQTSIRFQVDNSGVEIGTSQFADEWAGGAAVHQFGSRDDRIKKRPFLGLSTGDKTTVLEIIGRHLRGGPGQQ